MVIASTSASSPPNGAPPANPGVAHDVAAKLVLAIEAGDADAAGARFTDDATFVRWHAPDAIGRDAITNTFRVAFGLCKMHVVSVLQRQASFDTEFESTCARPGWSYVEHHLLVADVAADRITRGHVYTELFPSRDPDARSVRELEAPETMSTARAKAATCDIDRLVALLPIDFQGTITDVWGTPTCSVVTVKSTDVKRMHGYVEIDCGVPSNCEPSRMGHRYVDWNGHRLLPFADGFYIEKQEGGDDAQAPR